MDYLEIMDFCGYDLDRADELAEEYGDDFRLIDAEEENDAVDISE